MAASDFARPRFAAPAGACDTHMHFYSPKFPMVPGKTAPANAWVEDYREVQKVLGLTRVVAIQPTAYGRDNSCQLAAMAAFGANARGVMVVDETTPESELDRLNGLGVRGARFHMLPGGAVPWQIIEEVAARVHAFGWHIQLQLNGRELPEREALLKRLPGTLVVDHVGRFTPPVTVDDPAFKVLLRLLEGGRCWVKLSAPYESSATGAPAFEDVRPEARHLAKAYPQRMLWASNWPHPGQANPLAHAATMDLLAEWVDDEKTRQRILVDNPAELYGF
ncbi:amidohydrolase family protein [Shumkonia mesophila]|uniref:amidohydrolase family protein n=1 Tax=Shumkonia mesophila TaxID=2838854 RepID=UPI002934AA75|nr:amidohydrolase family protein [Shumkonia mesophila]